jgi:hypothetical protein
MIMKFIRPFTFISFEILFLGSCAIKTTLKQETNAEENWAPIRTNNRSSMKCLEGVMDELKQHSTGCTTSEEGVIVSVCFKEDA